MSRSVAPASCVRANRTARSRHFDVGIDERKSIFFSCLSCKAVYSAMQKRKPSIYAGRSFAKSARRRSISGGAVNTVLRIGGDRSTRPGAAAAIQYPKNNSQITTPHNVCKPKHRNPDQHVASVHPPPPPVYRSRQLVCTPHALICVNFLPLPPGSNDFASRKGRKKVDGPGASQPPPGPSLRDYAIIAALTAR